MTDQVCTEARQEMVSLAELGSITGLHLLQLFFISADFSSRQLLLELQILLLFVKSYCCIWPSSVYISARSTCKVQLYFPLHIVLLCCKASLRVWGFLGFLFLTNITHMGGNAHGKRWFHLHSLMQ